MVSGWMPIFRAISRAHELLQSWGMLTNPAGLNTLTHAIIGWGIRVHREIGPGVLENIYNECMQYELRQEGLRFDREQAVPLVLHLLEDDQITEADLREISRMAGKKR